MTRERKWRSWARRDMEASPRTAGVHSAGATKNANEASVTGKHHRSNGNSRGSQGAVGPAEDGVANHLAVYGSDRFGQRHPFGAKLYAVLSVVAIFDAAGAH